MNKTANIPQLYKTSNLSQHSFASYLLPFASSSVKVRNYFRYAVLNPSAGQLSSNNTMAPAVLAEDIAQFRAFTGCLSDERAVRFLQVYSQLRFWLVSPA